MTSLKACTQDLISLDTHSCFKTSSKVPSAGRAIEVAHMCRTPRSVDLKSCCYQSRAIHPVSSGPPGQQKSHPHILLAVPAVNNSHVDRRGPCMDNLNTAQQADKKPINHHRSPRDPLKNTQLISSRPCRGRSHSRLLCAVQAAHNHSSGHGKARLRTLHAAEQDNSRSTNPHRSLQDPVEDIRIVNGRPFSHRRSHYTSCSTSSQQLSTCGILKDFSASTTGPFRSAQSSLSWSARDHLQAAAESTLRQRNRPPSESVTGHPQAVQQTDPRLLNRLSQGVQQTTSKPAKHHRSCPNPLRKQNSPIADLPVTANHNHRSQAALHELLIASSVLEPSLASSSPLFSATLQHFAL